MSNGHWGDTKVYLLCEGLEGIIDPKGDDILVFIPQIVLVMNLKLTLVEVGA